MEIADRIRMPLLRPYQRDVLRRLVLAIREAPAGATFTIVFPRQAGKNETAAALVAPLLLAAARTGGSIIICTPTLEPQARISIERIKAHLRRAVRLLPELGRPRWEANRVALGRAEATFLSASPEAHVAGHTASIALIADEAQEIDRDWFERQFRPMAASTAAPVILFGTPWDGDTLLDRAVTANRRHDRTRVAGTQPWQQQVAWERVARIIPAYGRHVRAERERLGEHHPLFRTQYGLETVEEEGRLLTAVQLAVLEGVHGALGAPVEGERYVAGLDLAGDGTGGDRTVLTIARLGADRRCEVVAWRAWQGEPYQRVLDDTVALARRWQLARLMVDGTGIGGPLAGSLRTTLGDAVTPLVFTAEVKSELGYALVAAANTGWITLPLEDWSAEGRACRAEGRACRAELRACRAQYAGHRLRWGDAAEHDDYAVSLALCLRAAEGAGPPRVALGRRARERAGCDPRNGVPRSTYA